MCTPSVTSCPSLTARHVCRQDVFAALLQSFHAADSLILQQGGMLTTLTAAAVVPCQLAQGRTRARFVVCVCNVGDSLAYVFSSRHGVREITKGA